MKSERDELLRIAFILAAGFAALVLVIDPEGWAFLLPIGTLVITFAVDIAKERWADESAEIAGGDRNRQQTTTKHN